MENVIKREKWKMQTPSFNHNERTVPFLLSRIDGKAHLKVFNRAIYELWRFGFEGKLTPRQEGAHAAMAIHLGYAVFMTLGRMVDRALFASTSVRPSGQHPSG